MYREKKTELPRSRLATAGLRVLPGFLIVSVERGDEILLARSPHFPEGIMSVLAGFVEPGESAEDAVRREVFEEAGIIVDKVQYFSSQAWPFPNSLMLGFRARATHSRIDLTDDELAEAHWFSRRGLAEAIAAGRVRKPSPISISYRLIEEWFDAGEDGRLRDLDVVEAAV